MGDERKTKAQLIEELRGLRARLEAQAAQPSAGECRDLAAAVAELRASEAALDAAQEVSALGSFVWDLRDDSLTWSRNMYRLAGITPGEFSGTLTQVSRELIHPEDRDRVAAQVAEMVAQCRTWPMDFRLVRPDGAGRHVRCSSRFVFDEAGRPIQCVGVHYDLTERINQDAALRSSQQTLQSLLDAAPIGIGVIRERVFGWTNAQVTEITGYSLTELQGMEARRLYASEEEYRRVGRIKHAAIAATGSGAIETTWRRKDGRSIDVSLSAAYLDPERPAAGLISTVMDISERKATERALRHSEAQFRTFVENLADGVFCHDLDGRLTLVNQAACELSGYSRDELLGMRVMDIDAGSAVRDDQRRFWQALAVGEGTMIASEHRRKDGTTYPVEIHLNRIELGGEPHILGVARDMTARVRAEEERRAHFEEQAHLERQLLEAQKMEAVGRLAGGVAHDFNNLLQVIAGYTELARAAAPGGAALHEHLDEISGAGRRAAQLVQQLLAFGRRQVLQPEEVELGELVTDLLGMIRRVIGEHIAVRYRDSEAALWIDADRGQIEQALLNLCVNARDAMPQGGELTLRLAAIDELPAAVRQPDSEPAGARGAGFVRLSVSDTGSGIDAETRQHIFEPFFTTKEAGRGSGLGLATACGIVRQHGGEIALESEPGAGAEFSIYLPRVVPPVPSEESDRVGRRASAADGRLPETPAAHAITILVAEDDDRVRDLTVRVLTRAGYRVLAAPDGVAALELFGAHADEIGLVVLDVVMPRMGGRAVYDRLREVAPAIPVLFSSGYSGDGLHTDFVLEEGLHLIEKPHTPRELLERIRRLLEASD